MADIDTGTEDLLAREQDGVVVITLNRPAARNAMSGPMNAGLASVLAYAETAASVRAVVITGAGGAFCAGGDVKGMAAGGDAGAGGGDQPTLDERIHRQRLNQRNTAGRMFLMPKPVVASLPGAAAGAGLSLALSADLRIMADSAFITTAFAKVGFSGDYGGTFFLSQLVGLGKAKELYYLSDRVSAQDCLALGIANAVVPAEELEERAFALAQRLASGPPIALRYMKENFNRAAMGADVIECLDLEATHHVHSGLSEDHRNAAAAFVEKRQPEFVGR
ncbi:MAG: enoyl-CoA hydratase-related protein [Pseudomonadota bacterium]